MAADLSAYVNAPSTVFALVERAESAVSDLNQLKTLAAQTSVAYAERAQRAEHELSQVRPGRSFSRGQLNRLVQERKDEIRREELAKSDKARWSLLRKLKDTEESLARTADQFQSPSRILSRSGLGSPERSRYGEQLAHSGPVECLNYAQLAASTGDRVLGAAVLSRMDVLGREEMAKVGLTRQALAETLCGDDFKAAQAALNRIKNTVKEAVAENRALEAGRHQISPRDKIGLGLGRPGEEMPEGYEDADGGQAAA